jgi:hypothetical protein
MASQPWSGKLRIQSAVPKKALGQPVGQRRVDRLLCHRLPMQASHWSRSAMPMA